MAGLLDIYTDPQQAGMLGMTAGLLQAGGPSRMPVSFGQAISGGLLQGAQMQEAARRAQLSTALLNAQTQGITLANEQAVRQNKAIEDYAAQLPPSQAAVLRANPSAFIKAMTDFHALSPGQQLFQGTNPVATVAPNLSFQNTGGAVVGVNPQTGQPVTSMPTSVTPSAVLGANVTMRGQDIGATTAARGQNITLRGQDLSYGKGRFAAPQEVTGADGKPMMVQLDTHTGELVDANSKMPVTGIGPKLNQPTQPTVGQVAMVKAAGEDLTRYEDLLLPKDTKGERHLDRNVLWGTNIPFAAGGGFSAATQTKNREAYSALRNAIAAKLRLETGAQANDQEISEIAARFQPTPMDTEASAKDKVQRLKAFMSNTLSMTRGGNAAPQSAAPTILKFDAQGNPIP